MDMRMFACEMSDKVTKERDTYSFEAPVCETNPMEVPQTLSRPV